MSEKIRDFSYSSLLGSLVVQMAFVVALGGVFYVGSSPPSAWLIMLLFLTISLASYPFFRGEPLFWWRRSPVPVWAWVLHNLIGFVLVYILVWGLTRDY